MFRHGISSDDHAICFRSRRPRKSSATRPFHIYEMVLPSCFLELLQVVLGRRLMVARAPETVAWAPAQLQSIAATPTECQCQRGEHAIKHQRQHELRHQPAQWKGGDGQNDKGPMERA